MHEELHLVSDLALILIAAGVVTLIFKWLKQPLVLGYIVAGFLVGPHFDLFPTVIAKEGVAEWSEIGIIFLLFALGLEFSFKKLVNVGASAVITAITEIVFMFFIGYIVGRVIGWTNIESIFLGGMLCMSSTMIILKTYNDFGLKNQKFAHLVLGTLIVEDLVAILLLVMLSTIAVSSSFSGGEMIFSLLKLAFFLVLSFLVGIYVLPSLLRKTKRWLNNETLLIISIGLCFGMVALATYVGFSAALGAFLMGSILAETVEGEHIEHLISNIKDLFGAIFFVSVGMLVNPAVLAGYWVIILVLSLVVIIGQSLSSGTGVLLSGQSLKTAAQAGFSMAQIGEFSFIIATLGVQMKVLSPFIYPIIVAVSVVTTFTTPYYMQLATPFYNWLTPRLSPRTKDFLDRYAAGSNTVTAESDWKNLLKYYLLHIVVYSVLIIAVILCFTQFINPFVYELLHFPSLVVNLINATLTLIVMLPFLLGLITTSRSKQEIFKRLLRENRNNRGKLAVLLFVQVLFAIFFVMGMLFYTLKLSAWIIISVTVVIFLVIFFLRKKIKFYQLIQARFLYNLNQKDEIEKKRNPISNVINNQLSNRDIHFAELVVSPDSPFIGKQIKELNVRKNYGVNIVRINRGNKDIFFPSGDEFIYPADHLLAIGTDEQINSFTDIMEHQVVCDTTPKPEISLTSFVVQTDSPLLGKSIAESKIRDAGCLIVGVDRQGESIMNPDHHFMFETGDLVWVVGKKQDIERILIY